MLGTGECLSCLLSVRRIRGERLPRKKKNVVFPSTMRDYTGDIKNQVRPEVNRRHGKVPSQGMLRPGEPCMGARFKTNVTFLFGLQMITTLRILLTAPISFSSSEILTIENIKFSQYTKIEYRRFEIITLQQYKR